MRMSFRGSLQITLPVLCLITISCGMREKPANDAIRAGIITSLTGPEARFGQAQKYGYEMALEEIQATGVLGKNLELLYQDDTSKPEVASLTVEKLADRSDIVAIFGAYSSAANFAAAAV